MKDIGARGQTTISPRRESVAKVEITATKKLSLLKQTASARRGKSLEVKSKKKFRLVKKKYNRAKIDQ